MDPELDPVQLLLGRPAEVGREREHQEHEGGEHEQVAVTLKVTRAAHEGKGDHIGEDAQDGPDSLVVPGGDRGHLGGVVEPEDHDEPDAVQHEDDRHHDRVGLRGEVTVRHMDHERQADGDGDELDGVGRQHVVGPERGEQVGEGEHHDSDDEQAELAPSPLFHPRGHGEGLHELTVASGL